MRTAQPITPCVGLSLDDLKQSTDTISWLWQGYLAHGQVTLLTSQWKAGKTTLISVLLDRLREGGTLAGLPLHPGRAVILSEESTAQWRARLGRLPFGSHVMWFCRPFRGKPTLEQWLAFIDQLAALHRAAPFDLLIVDPLACFLPGRSENAAGPMLEALLPLQQLTQAGLAVLLLHHPRKHTSADGEAARGSGALSSFADILIEMHYHARAAESDRRRRLLAFSRSDGTPRQLVIELDPAGADYISRGDFGDQDFADHWAALAAVLDDAPHKLTRQEILARWPADHPAVTPITLWCWLDRAVARGLLRCDGSGKKNQPFRYWLPSQEEKWQRDPLAALRQQTHDDHQFLLRSMEAACAPQPRRKPRRADGQS